MPKVLIVEDEPELAKLLAEYLENSAIETHIITDGQVASNWLEANHADLLILDLMLPGMDGTTLCKKVRGTSDVPIIMATARVEEIDRLLGLEIGADDYVCKPYSPREIVARVKAILRRVSPAKGDTSPDLPSIVLDSDKLTVSVNGTAVHFTTIEIRLFELLFREPGKIFSRQYIMDNIYNDYRVVSDRTVDSHIKKLRKKLHEAVPKTELIHSIYGAGYKFERQDV